MFPHCVKFFFNSWNALVPGVNGPEGLLTQGHTFFVNEGKRDPSKPSWGNFSGYLSQAARAAEVLFLQTGSGAELLKVLGRFGYLTSCGTH